MSRQTELKRLADEIRGRFKGPRAVSARVLPGGQLLIGRGWVDNPLAGSGLKAEAHKPAPEGFEIYVEVRPQTAPDPGPAQLARPWEPSPPLLWDSGSKDLTYDLADTGAEWKALNGAGDQVTIRVRSGRKAAAEDVREILSILQACLLESS